MKKNNWVLHVILFALDIVILLSVWFAYADSHGMLSIKALTNGTFSNTAISIIHLVSFPLALLPYGCCGLILTILKHAREQRNAAAGCRAKTRYVIAMVPVFVFTAAAKFLLFMSTAGLVLHPENFHI